MDFELTEEQKMIQDMCRRFADKEIKPVAAKLDETKEHPASICEKMGELGLMGIAIPEKYGGAGMDYISYMLAMIEISKACASTGVIMSVNNSLYCFPINTFGNDEQKQKYLTPVASGQSIGCYAIGIWDGYAIGVSRFVLGVIIHRVPIHRPGRLADGK